MDTWVYINGEWLPNAEAKISVLDLSILRGYGVNDYMRTYGREFFELKEHIIRFQRSAEEVGLKVPFSAEAIATMVEGAKDHVSTGEISLKLMLTGGISPDQFLPVGNSTFFIVAYPLVPFPEIYFKKGIKVITECYTRPIPQAKSIHYLPAIVAMQKAKKEAAADVLFHTEQGTLLETSTANFFAVKKGTIITPVSSILIGITRQVVLELAKKKFPVEERDINLSEIPSFDGAFLTSSNKEVMPISQINAHPLSIPEEVRTLMQDFSKFTSLQHV